MRRAVVPLVVGGLLLGGPALAASPTPSPEDRSTTLTVTPRALPDRGVLRLSGFSDCAVIDGHLLFTRYDGTPDSLVVRARQSTTYDARREKFPFALRMAVPASARPGTAQVYAEPFCGPPEEYPPSSRVTVRITRSALVLAVSPRRPVQGAVIRVRATTCDGPGGRLTVRVRLAGAVAQRSAPIGGDGSAVIRVPLPAGSGRAQVDLPLAARECPGSTAPASVTITVRAAAAASASPSQAVLSASPSATPSPSGSSRATASSPQSGRAVPKDSATGGGAGGVPVLLGLGGAAALAGGAATVWARRRRTGS